VFPLGVYVGCETLVDRVWRELVVGVGPSKLGCSGRVVVYSSILVMLSFSFCVGILWSGSCLGSPNYP